MAKELSVAAINFTDDAKVIGKMITAFATANKKVHMMAHAIAVSCTIHAIAHGNTTPANDFIKSFGTSNGWRVNALREWFETFGPFTWDAKSKSLRFSSKKNEECKVKFKSNEVVSFWDLKPEPEYKGIDLNAEIIRIVKKANEALKSDDPAHKGKDKINVLQLRKLADLVNLGAEAAA